VLNCTVCKSASYLETSFSDVELHRCSACGHCFTAQESLKKTEVYDTSYFLETHKNWFSHPDILLFQNILKLITEQKKINVLDVGCGNGNFLKFLRSANSQLSLTGIDVAENSAAAGIDFIQADFLEWNHPNKFDVVVSLAVIEHVNDIRLFSNKLAQFTKDGGLVVVMTVNENSVPYKVARICRSLGFRAPFERLYSHHHLNHFTKNSLATLMRSADLKPVQKIMHNGPLRAVDFESSSFATGMILKTGVAGMFLLGNLSHNTLLQTIVCKKEGI
jgi:2-polyprenyl-3-methyl-5-hydroxy-6-metoxy-1,4-benzoquinol methylase